MTAVLGSAPTGACEVRPPVRFRRPGVAAFAWRNRGEMSIPFDDAELLDAASRWMLEVGKRGGLDVERFSPRFRRVLRDEVEARACILAHQVAQDFWKSLAGL